MKQYQADLMEEGKLPLGRALKPTPHQALVREMILQPQTRLPRRWILKNKFDVDITEHWKEQYQQHAENGMLNVTPDRIELTRKGFLHADALLPVFFEAEHQGIRYT